MGAFNINITGVGGHGCERKAKAGDKLYGRCGRFTCPDCMAFDFVQRMKQSGMVREYDFAGSIEVSEGDLSLLEYLALPDEQRAAERPGPQYFKTTDGKWYRQVKQFAEFTHWPYDQKNKVVDDMLTNERKEGQF